MVLRMSGVIVVALLAAAPGESATTTRDGRCGRPSA
jgi:hypothetical protein